LLLPTPGADTPLRDLTRELNTAAHIDWPLSRELSANDWQDRTDVRRGDLSDRNVQFVVPAPF
jgi:hypothetical protein